MKVTIAIDSFKGSLSTFQAGEAAAEGVRKVFPDARITICPLADGGEGTVDAVICNQHGIDAFFPILRHPCSLQEAMHHDNAYKNLVDTAEQVFRLIRAVISNENNG